MNYIGIRKSFDKKKILEEILGDLQELDSLTSTKKLSEKSQGKIDKFTSQKKEESWQKESNVVKAKQFARKWKKWASYNKKSQKSN